MGDARRLSVLNNLLGNAISSPNRGHCAGSYTTDQQRQRWLQVSVQDTGIGMTAEQQAQRFGRSAQADLDHPALRWHRTGTDDLQAHSWS